MQFLSLKTSLFLPLLQLKEENDNSSQLVIFFTLSIANFVRLEQVLPLLDRVLALSSFYFGSDRLASAKCKSI